MVGTMIEVPRGALTADEIAQTAEFFSFGTNDLTQTALGISRDDMGNFLMPYIENEIFKKNPSPPSTPTGVGQLMEIAVDKGRKTRPNIKLGICGEHGGDPDCVKFCHKLGLDLRELLALTACPSPASPPPRPRSRKSAPPPPSRRARSEPPRATVISDATLLDRRSNRVRSDPGDASDRQFRGWSGISDRLKNSCRLDRYYSILHQPPNRHTP